MEMNYEDCQHKFTHQTGGHHADCPLCHEPLPTPGPWHYDAFADREWVLAEPRSKNTLPIYIAEMVYEDEEGLFIADEKERIANARLIAAAPDLLNSAMAIIYEIDHPSKVGMRFEVDKLRAAIAKAQGRKD